MKKNWKYVIPILIVPLLATASVFSQQQQVAISIDTSTQPPDSPAINDRLSFLVPLAYQAGPFQTIKICGKISNSESSTVQANLDVYTKLEGDTDLLTEKKIEYDYTMGGVKGHGGPYTVSGNRYPSSGTTVFTLSPGDYLHICWVLKVGSANREGKVRAYFYAKERNFNIIKEKYSEWVTIKPQPPALSGWDTNIIIYGGAAALIVLALLRAKGII